MAFIIIPQSVSELRKAGPSAAASPALRRKSKMVVYGDRGHLLADEAGGLAPRGRLPIVLAFPLRNPRRQLLVQMGRQRVNVRFVTVAHCGEFLLRFRRVTQSHSVLRQLVAKSSRVRRRQPLPGPRARRSAKNLGKIDERVPRDGEGQLRLALA